MISCSRILNPTSPERECDLSFNNIRTTSELQTKTQRHPVRQFPVRIKDDCLARPWGEHLHPNFVPNMVLPTRKISDAQVTSIGYGAMSFAPFYSTHTIPEEEELKVHIMTP